MASPTLFVAALLLILAFGFVESACELQLLANAKWLAGLHRSQRGCWARPWICLRGGDPSVKCCRNRCVDVGSDRINCGRCGIRCPLVWCCCHPLVWCCCHGECINVVRSPYHCGSCDTQCPLHVRCRFGLCGSGDSSFPPPFDSLGRRFAPPFRSPPRTRMSDL